MTSFNFSTEFINEMISSLKAEDDSYVYFNSAGFISTYLKNNSILSLKSRLAFFNGCLSGFQVNGMTKIPKKYLELRVSSPYELEIKRGSFSTKVNIYPKKDPAMGLKLWDEDIQWQNCPGELVEELFRISGIADDNQNSDQPVFSAVQICRNYLIAADYNFNRFARYTLSTSFPFNTSLLSWDIKYILSRVKGKRLIRVAELEILYDGSKTLGLAFDFGDLRIWIPSAGLLEKNQCPEPERGGGFVTYGCRPMIHTVSDILNTPCQFIVVLPSPSKPPFSAPVGDEPITVKFMSGKIQFRYRDDNLKWKEKLIFKNMEIKTPFILSVDPVWFLQAYRKHKLMGVIDYHGHIFLYFKNKHSEQVLMATKPVEGGNKWYVRREDQRNKYGTKAAI